MNTVYVGNLDEVVQIKKDQDYVILYMKDEEGSESEICIPEEDFRKMIANIQKQL